MRNIVIIIICFILFMYSFAQNAQTGTTAAAFTKIGIGSRMMSMGEAYTAVSDDLNALYANVAGLGMQHNFAIGISHLDWIAGLKYESLNASHPIYFHKEQKDRIANHVLGYSINYLHDRVNSYGEWGDHIDTVSVNNVFILAGYGWGYHEWSGGLSTKFISENFGSSQQALGFDAGVMWTTHLKPYTLFGQTWSGRPITLGANLANFGTKAHGTGGAYPLATELSFGFSGQFFPLYTIALDIAKPFDYNRVKINIGMEYWLRGFIALRMGYRFFGYEIDGFTVGIGMKHQFAGKTVQLDIAFMPQSVFNNVNNISLQMRFPGQGSPELANLWYYKGIQQFVDANYEEAIVCWNKCLEINPLHELAAQKIDEARQLIKMSEIENNIDIKMKEGGTK